MVETDENYHETSYFEGVEKLLEIWFKKKEKSSDSSHNITNCDLRNIPRKCFEMMLQTVHCEVVSFTQNKEVDAYVLSESSMFVAERRFILKTCGTTTPLECLPQLLKLVELYTGFTDIEDLFYSRKNFKRPELQKNPHRAFEQEVDFLNKFFRGGVGYCLGNPDGDCWYMYALNGKRNNNCLDHVTLQTEADQTLEILMTDLDQQVMEIFTKKCTKTSFEATKKSGINTILPEMRIDDFLFEPCGYSMNGIGPNGSYMTIHITPETDFSYVSFETNYAATSYEDVIKRVINVFKPGKFVLTVFANKKSLAETFPKQMGKYVKTMNFGDLQCREVRYCQLHNYDLGFAFYSKFPS